MTCVPCMTGPHRCGQCGPRPMGAAPDISCTGRYAALVNNGIGGTLDQPCANAAGWQLYCNEPDVEAWHATAWDLFVRVRRAWNVTVAEVGAVPPLVKEFVTALEVDYGTSSADGTITTKLPGASFWNPTENAKASSVIAHWCSRAACALELLENVRGVRGPVESTPEHVPIIPGFGLGGISMVLLVGVALWVMSRGRR